MSMSKKDFIALADQIMLAKEYGYCTFTEDQLELLGNFCKKQNPAFKFERWIDYIKGECGPCGGETKKEKIK